MFVCEITRWNRAAWHIVTNTLVSPEILSTLDRPAVKFDNFDAFLIFSENSADKFLSKRKFC